MTRRKMYAKFLVCAVLLTSLLLPVLFAVAEEESGGTSNEPLGKTLVEKKCTICHSIDRVHEADKTHSEWEQTIAKMMRYSDQMNFLNQQEREDIIDYLAGRKRAGGEQP